MEPPPRSRTSRRRFLALTALGLAALGTVAAWSPLRRFVRALRAPLLPEAAPGPLADEVSETLVAMVSATLQTQVEPAHYAAMFAFYAQQVPGYRALYEQLAADWNTAASAHAKRAFARCSTEQQRTIAAAAFPSERPVGTLWASLTDSGSLLAARYFRAPVVQLFVRTDALRLIGYEDWPGTPRLLDHYTKPIAS